MDIMEIILLVAGGIIFVLSFFIPDRKTTSGSAPSGDEVRALVEEELAAARNHADEIVEETVSYTMEKTERSLERLSNEKIMAVNEYSETVLAEIHKNHEEVMFLYDMLNHKHDSLKNTVAEINRTVREAEKAMEDLRRALPEAAEAESQTVGTSQSEQTEAVPEPDAPAEVTAETAPDYVEEASGEDSEAGRNNKERIMKLYREGKSAASIAKELELGVGEVRLVIDLYQNQ